jgi:hypothetical protein
LGEGAVVDGPLTTARRQGIEAMQLDLACALELRALGPPDEACLHPAAALRFLTGGNATFTLLNLQTKQRCTLRVSGRRSNHTVGTKSLLIEEQTGQDNVRDFTCIGTFMPDWLLTLFKRTGRGTATIAWLHRKLWSPGFVAFPPTVRFMHAGRCCRCGRVLTVPESIASGIGPECARRKNVLTKPGDPLHGLI